MAVEPVLRRSAEMVRPLIQEKGHRLVIQVPDDLPPVLAQQRGLVQIVVNLLSNAAKYTPAGGEIVLRAVAAGPGTIRVEVEDNGIGISPEDQQHLFTYWYQVGGKHEHNMQGAGIGLALTRTLVDRFAGALEVQSEKDSGSTFAVTLAAQRQQDNKEI